MEYLCDVFLTFTQNYHVISLNYSILLSPNQAHTTFYKKYSLIIYSKQILKRGYHHFQSNKLYFNQYFVNKLIILILMLIHFIIFFVTFLQGFRLNMLAGLMTCFLTVFVSFFSHRFVLSF